jgi:hypothetical protein
MHRGREHNMFLPCTMIRAAGVLCRFRGVRQVFWRPRIVSGKNWRSFNNGRAHEYRFQTYRKSFFCDANRC